MKDDGSYCGYAKFCKKGVCVLKPIKRVTEESAIDPIMALAVLIVVVLALIAYFAYKTRQIKKEAE